MFDPGQSTPTVKDLVLAMREADSACTRAVGLLMAVGGATIARETAMPAEMALSLDARWTRHEVSSLFAVAEALATLPLTRAALASGEISFAQARQITYEVRTVDASGRATIDALVDELAPD
jgi:hypothetical protein